MLSSPLPNPLDEALEQLGKLRQFTGTPAEFWPQFIAACAKLIQADRGILILSDAADPSRLKKLSEWTDNSAADRATMAFARVLPEVAAKALKSGNNVTVLDDTSNPARKNYSVALKLPLPATQNQCVAAFLARNATEADTEQFLVRLKLAADVPLAFLANQQNLQNKTDAEKFASVHDILALVNAETRFRAAALALCNGLAAQFNCSRVSLGWLEGGYVRLKNISRTERFDPRMAAVKAIEVVMEESLDQNDEITFPAAANSLLISKDHEKFSKEQGSANVISVPLRLDDKPIAVITAERDALSFSATELQQMRLACDQTVRRLEELHRQDRWFGARWSIKMKEQLTKIVGPEHTWAKISALGGVGVLILLFLPIFNYRIEGNFILRSEQVVFLTAPYDSYIKSVDVRPGDVVEKDGALLQLNTDDLELEETAALADQNRYLRESEKSRAAKQLAEMRVAQALSDQAKARLDLIRYRLSQAKFKSPFRGVLIEGDLRQKLGAPVKVGDALLKIASTEQLYVEAEINERDVHEISEKSAGEIAFVSQPKLKFPVKITRIEPSATPKEKMNVFITRAAFEKAPESWWRPGMSGVCKINVEHRTLFWIITHRTVDTLRMFFWW